jgi:rsbT co-antagonist protein RsbR
MTTEDAGQSEESESDLEKALARIAELEARVATYEAKQKATAHWLFEALDRAGIGAWDWDITLDKVEWNDALYAIYGIDRTSFGGNLKAVGDLAHPEDKHILDERVGAIFTNSEPEYFIEYRVIRKDGRIRWLAAHGFAYRDATGKPYRLAGVTQDVTDQKNEQEHRYAMQQGIIEAQRESLRQLGAPIIPLRSNALAMPLVGALTPERSMLVTETLLQAVTDKAAEYVILDVTGVPSIDSEVADGLLRVAQAVRLLGAEVALTGMQPAVARALVELGVDMSKFVTKADLQGGIAWASKRGSNAVK